MDRKNRRVTYLTGANATFNAYGMNDDQKKKKNKSGGFHYAAAILRMIQGFLFVFMDSFVLSLPCFVACFVGHSAEFLRSGVHQDFKEPFSDFRDGGVCFLFALFQV